MKQAAQYTRLELMPDISWMWDAVPIFTRLRSSSFGDFDLDHHPLHLRELTELTTLRLGFMGSADADLSVLTQIKVRCTLSIPLIFDSGGLVL